MWMMLRNNEITTGFDLASTLTNEMTSGGCNDAGKERFLDSD